MAVNIPDDATVLQVLALALATGDLNDRYPTLGEILDHPVTCRLCDSEHGFLNFGKRWIDGMTRTAAPTEAGGWIARGAEEGLAVHFNRPDLCWLEESAQALELREMVGLPSPWVVLQTLRSVYRSGDSCESLLNYPPVVALGAIKYLEIPATSIHASHIKRLAISPDNTFTVLRHNGTTHTAKLAPVTLINCTPSEIVSHVLAAQNLETQPGGRRWDRLDVTLGDTTESTVRPCTLWPVPMVQGFPSEIDDLWPKFVRYVEGESALCGSSAVDDLRHFMRLHGTEAFTDGREEYTLVGHSLAAVRVDVCGRLPALHTLSSADLQVGQGRYLLCDDWSHLFAERAAPVRTRWVLDRDSEQLVAAQFQDGVTWRGLGRGDSADLLESLQHNEVLTTPGEFDVRAVRELPDWAGGTPWAISDVVAKNGDRDYAVYSRQINGGVSIWQVTPAGAPPPSEVADGGYYDLDALAKLKGLTLKRPQAASAMSPSMG